MRYETKKGLLKSRPLKISQVYTKKQLSDRNFAKIITTFTNEKVVRDLLFKFVNGMSFNMSVKVFEKQLKLLEPLTLDEKIRILNNTVVKGWNSLVFEYNKVMNTEENNENK